MIEIINQDCIEYLHSIDKDFDFIFADPPFNIGQKYKGFYDKQPLEKYRSWLSDWISACFFRLKSGAVMMLHGSPMVAREMLFQLRNLALERYIEQEIVWAFNFGQCTFDRFIETHCRAIVVRKPGINRKWNVEGVLTPSTRLRLGDKRTINSRFGGYVPYGTVWGLSTDDSQIVKEPLEPVSGWGRVQGNNRERRSLHPNQLPERYLARCVAGYSFENDLVYDPFGGSGTTAVACKKLNRNCITTDISLENCNSINERLNNVQ